MSAPQINVMLSRLANLANAEDDYQSFMQQGEGDDALLSRGMMADNIEAIRAQLVSLERATGIVGSGPVEIHAVPDRPSDDWPDAA